MTPPRPPPRPSPQDPRAAPSAQPDVAPRSWTPPVTCSPSTASTLSPPTRSPPRPVSARGICTTGSAPRRRSSAPCSTSGPSACASPPSRCPNRSNRTTQTQQPDPAYAFFLRDLLPLLHTDPVLAKAYRQGYTTRRDEFVRAVERIIDAGLLHPPAPPTTIRDLVSLLWLVSETAQPFASIVDDPRIDSQCYGRAIIEPHLTEAGRRALHLPTNADNGDHA